ncbi:MAG TPA: pyridoxal-dependent decarboxylase [Thermoleophilaceae bacterium]|nr:pyridoxal-dependent decarboxylase [Thermoleophilaceae bacterium]
MTDSIEATTAAALPWDTAEYDRLAAIATAAVARFVEESQRADAPVGAPPPLPELIERLRLRELVRGEGLDADTFEPWLEDVLAHSVRLHHPAEIAHQVSNPDVPAAIADLIQGAINQPMSIYEMGPAAHAAERVVIEWMCEKVGWPAGAGGVLTHGGSLANLTVLLAARAVAAPDAWVDGVDGSLAVLAPPGSHYSVKRSAAMLGLGERSVIDLEVDAQERIVPAALPDALERCEAEGRRPMALVAAACATSTGLHDDLEAIGAFCREHGIWFHVDAAHGATALLSPEHRHLLKGIELGDSVIWDAHKMMRTPALAAGVLLRDDRLLEAAFRQKAAYLIYEGEPEEESTSLLQRQVECTKAALGMRIFMNLAFRGEEGIGQYVGEQYDKTARFHELIETRPGFESLCAPESNILCFRYGREGEEQVRIRERLLEEKRFHLSSTEVNGERWLRMTVTAPATTEATIEGMLDAIEALAS